MSLFEATRYVASVPDIDLDRLEAAGISCILLDRDNTCVPRDTRVAPPAVLSWIADAQARGMLTYMVSNNFNATAVQRSAAELGLKGISHALKPLPFNIRRALKNLGVSAEQAVLVGDQVFTDVIGGNLAGVATILVHPQTTVDLWYMGPFRAAEAAIIGKRVYEGEDTSQGV